MTGSTRPGPRFPGAPTRLATRTAALALLGLLLPLAAHADPKDDARRHFAAGLQAAQAGDFEIALQRFLAAQEAYPHPVTLYNIAKSYQDLDDVDNALVYYRLFRQQAPERAAEVDGIIAALEAHTRTPVDRPSPSETQGPARVVVSGPSAEELARLEAIAAELQALQEAFRARADADLAAADAQPDDPDPQPDPEPVEPEEPAIPEVEGDFLTAAYDRIVVTASRVGQDPLDSPSTLTVLTETDIRMSGATTLPDLLRRVVGVDAMSLSSGHSDLSIRGFNRELGNKVLVLIDGRSTYMDFIGVTLWTALPIQLEEIERIEVIRGPGSAVYGANAVTGVINIITRTPGDQPGNQITAEGGAPGYARTVFLSSGRTDNVSYRISGGYHQMGRWSREFPAGDRPVDYFFDNQDRGLQTFKANGRIDSTFGDKGFASVSAGFTKGDFEYYNIGALPNYGFDSSNGYVRGDLAWGDLLLRAFWNSDYGTTAPWFEYVGQNRSLAAEMDNDAIDVELGGPLTFSTGEIDHVLNLGVGYRYKRVAMSYLQGGFDNPFVEHHLNAFVNEQATIGRLGVVGSLRIDRHPLLQLSETISPRAALLYRLFDKTSLRATAGTAFRAPNSVESYMDFNLSNPAADGAYVRDLGGSSVIGTTPLSPERITTFEVGLHDESSYFHNADVVVYMNQVRHLIGLDAVSPSALPYDPAAGGFQAGQTGWINLAPEFTGVGVEGELELYPTDGLDLFANVNVMQIVEQDPATGEAVTDRSASPVKVNVGAYYRTPWRTDLSFAGHYVSQQTWRLRGFGPDGSIVVDEREVPARFLLTARAAVRPFADEALEVAGTVWNLTGLLGRSTIEHPGGQAVGGMAFGSVTYRF